LRRKTAVVVDQKQMGRACATRCNIRPKESRALAAFVDRGAEI